MDGAMGRKMNLVVWVFWDLCADFGAAFLRLDRTSLFDQTSLTRES